MSIELKQAAQDAAEAIDWLLNNIRRDAPQLSGKAMGNAEKCASALRSALAKQPATPEPVAQWQKRHPVRTGGRWISTDEHDAKWWSEHSRGWEARPLYTHPAPGVHADVARDAERYRFILAAADDMTTSRYKALCELLGVAITEDFDLGAAIDDAPHPQQPKEPS